MRAGALLVVLSLLVACGVKAPPRPPEKPGSAERAPAGPSTDRT